MFAFWHDGRWFGGRWEKSNSVMSEFTRMLDKDIGELRPFCSSIVSVES